MFRNINIINPKIVAKEKSFSKYYAGFNDEFVKQFLLSSELDSSSKILDPWNGVGTTTTNANFQNYSSIGCDINPVMGLYAKARLFKQEDVKMLLSIRDEIVNQVLERKSVGVDIKNDPLLDWFSPGATKNLRKIEINLKRLLLSDVHNDSANSIEVHPSIVCFFYVGIFKTLQTLAKDFKSSNPTWIKKPKVETEKLRPPKTKILSIFKNEIENILCTPEFHGEGASEKNVDIRIKSSLNTGITDNSVDLVLTSPPYCTRIDYAITTQIELALLRFNSEQIRNLRDQMIGTSTIYADDFECREEWGEKTNLFLEQVYNHASKASQTYYYRSHFQYYQSMYKSICHLSQDVIKPGGGLVLVVQDSFYKDIHNNLQENLIDLASKTGLDLQNRIDFKVKRSMSSINSKSNKYRNFISPTESVLCFTKS
ncbi:DNA methyltransferase [Salinimicrobium sp. TH3]|uniref:DNA methyltransferase n=1 Tax=Salinimicrobium sp. TH3 TaxID=2997342 RepID=UPI002273157C|nr:DNA methyltransferase [Salinimicrobium sp. TH3]MCY2686002.1 DNA methyltransferase [Salinimicrobium sp. TH3]